MPADRFLRKTFRNFSTLWLVVASVTVPLNLALAYLFRDVLAVAELHSQIAELPDRFQVKNVSARDLQAHEWWWWGLLAVQLLLVPLLARASGAVVDADASGRVTGGAAAWRRAVATSGGSARAAHNLPTVALGALTAALLILAARSIGLLALAPLPDEINWLGAGLVEGASWATGLPFLLIALNLGRAGDENGDSDP